MTVICTTLLIEKSPQALPLGAACIASAIKNYAKIKNDVDVKLKAFSMEDDEFKKFTENRNEQAAEFIVDEITRFAGMHRAGDECCGGEGNESCSDTGISRAPDEIDEITSASGIHRAGDECSGSEGNKCCSDTGIHQPPAIICFSTFVWNVTILQRASQLLRKKGFICIAGGPEITAHPSYYKDFDYTVSGEGELSVPLLIEKILKPHSAEKSEHVINSKLPDLAVLHSPYLDGIIDPSEYGGALWELARGCPFKCAYCYESKGEKTVRLFPMERIKAELELFAKKKIPQVFVLDPTYNVNKKRAVELLRMIASKTPNTFYYFEARAEFIDRELAKEFTRIPCALQIGLQSANEETLRLVNRPFDKKKFVRGLTILNEEGVTFGLDLIFGLPGETFGSFREGIDFAISQYPNNLEIFCLSVLPGTDLFDRANSLGLVYEDKPPYHVIRTKQFTVEEMERSRKLAAACSYFYNAGRAVTWFNPVCRVLKMKPSKFFEQFYEKFGKECEENSCCCKNHEEIEKDQLAFLKGIFTEHKQEKYFRVVEDIVKFYGAISRTTDTGKSEIVTLNYNADYVASDYASDIKWFYENVKSQRCRIQTFINGGEADFRFIKN